MAKITVTNTTSTLSSLLNTASITPYKGTSDVHFKNSDPANTVYIAIGGTANTSTSYPIDPGEQLDVANVNWDDIQLIASTNVTAFYALRRNSN